MSVLEIILWIIGALAAVLALGKVMHEKKCEDTSICSSCGQSLPSPKDDSQNNSVPK